MNERKLTKSELAKREDIIMKMKKNKRSLVQKYGKDAEAVMYGRATKLAKKQAEAMDQDRIKEMVKAALMNPVKEDQVEEGNAFIVAADAARDAGKKEFEFPKGSGKMHPVTVKADIDEIDLDLKGGTEKDKDADIAGVVGAEDVLGLEEGASTEEKRIAMRAIKSIAKYRGVSEDEARNDLMRAAKELGSLKEAIKDIKETIESGKNLTEELCAKGKAYIKKRKAAGEKSSAYLSGRAVKVCKGQIKG